MVSSTIFSPPKPSPVKSALSNIKSLKMATKIIIVLALLVALIMTFSGTGKKTFFSVVFNLIFMFVCIFIALTVIAVKHDSAYAYTKNCFDMKGNQQYLARIAHLFPFPGVFTLGDVFNDVAFHKCDYKVK